MRVGVLGLGKLGLPVALALEHVGHELVGWDVSESRRAEILARDVGQADHEPDLKEYLDESKLKLTPRFDEERPEVVLVCVQTPHRAELEGTMPLTSPPADFDYSWLRQALRGIVRQIRQADEWDPLVAIVSTCLPGTFDRVFRPMTDGVRVVYHPLFIAMGSVIPDFYHPEFVLVGTDECLHASNELLRMYDPVFSSPVPPVQQMSIVSAELTKVAYNAFVGFKLMLANGMMMLSEETGANADDVMSTLTLARKRLISPAYLYSGMGDGGACHPRDQIALSWLARKHKLFDMFEPVIRARERHAKWLADLWRASRALPLIQLGLAYKPDTNLTVGSHAVLLRSYANPDEVWDEPPGDEQWRPAHYFLATPHTWILDAISEGKLPPGSTLVDPWGFFDTVPGVAVHTPGRRRK